MAGQRWQRNERAFRVCEDRFETFINDMGLGIIDKLYCDRCGWPADEHPEWVNHGAERWPEPCHRSVHGPKEWGTCGVCGWPYSTDLRPEVDLSKWVSRGQDKWPEPCHSEADARTALTDPCLRCGWLNSVHWRCYPPAAPCDYCMPDWYDDLLCSRCGGSIESHPACHRTIKVDPTRDYYCESCRWRASLHPLAVTAKPPLWRRAFRSLRRA